jgi:hypothetical protein
MEMGPKVLVANTSFDNDWNSGPRGNLWRGLPFD